MILSLQKLKELLPEYKLDRRGKNLTGKCPKCGQNTFGISIFKDENPFGCYRGKCGFKGNIFTLAKFLNRMDLVNMEGEVGKIDILENKIIKKEESKLDLRVPKGNLPVGWKRIYDDEYLESRGFIEFNRYKVGRTAIDPRTKKDYVIFAIEEEGEVKGWIARNIKSKIECERTGKLRYINSDSDFSKLLYGYDEIVKGKTKTIICVEGIFDFFNVSRLLKLDSQEEVKCNATFKCNISPEQVEKWKLKGVENLILFYDSDVIKQIKHVANELLLHFNVMIAFNDKTGDDPGDIDLGSLEWVFNNLQSVSQFTSNKVETILK